MLKPADHWFSIQKEPFRSCLQFLRNFILNYDDGISESWKYGMPFYCYRGKMICYLWIHQKRQQPYIGFVDGALIDHSSLLQEKRTRMKIMPVDPSEDIDEQALHLLLGQMLALRD